MEMDRVLKRVPEHLLIIGVIRDSPYSGSNRRFVDLARPHAKLALGMSPDALLKLYPVAAGIPVEGQLLLIGDQVLADLLDVRVHVLFEARTRIGRRPAL